MPHPALHQIERATEQAQFDMPSDQETGAVLAALANSKPNGAILEIGTGTGLGTSWLLHGMTADAKLTSIDLDTNTQAIARAHLGDDPRVHFAITDAGQWLRGERSLSDQATPNGPYDLIFADAWPGKYSHLDEALSLLAPGGIYLVDDLLPQPNWPDGHQANVDRLITDLTARAGLHCAQLDCATGLLIATAATTHSS